MTVVHTVCEGHEKDALQLLLTFPKAQSACASGGGDAPAALSTEPSRSEAGGRRLVGARGFAWASPLDDGSEIVNLKVR